MTSQDFIRTEAANTDRIILYREGLFWKAYERSAFAVCSQVRAFKTTKKALKTLGGGAFGLHRVSRGERERRVRGFGVHFARAGPGGLRRSAGRRCRGVRGLEGRAAAQGGRAPDENRCRRCRRCRCRCRCRRCCRNRFCTRTSSRRTDAFAVGGRIPAGDVLRRGRFLADGGLPGRRSAEGIQSGRENAPGVHDVSLRT